MLRSLILITLTFILTGCATLEKIFPRYHTNSKQYLRTEATPSLKLPPNYPPNSIGNDFKVPRVAKTNYPAPPSSILPPGSLAEQVAQGKIPASALQIPKKPVIKKGEVPKRS